MYLARDIPAFVMYCVYEESRSSLLIEYTDSMIYSFVTMLMSCLPSKLLFVVVLLMVGSLYII